MQSRTNFRFTLATFFLEIFLTAGMSDVRGGLRDYRVMPNLWVFRFFCSRQLHSPTASCRDGGGGGGGGGGMEGRGSGEWRR